MPGDLCIPLPYDDPCIFELFVEWMLHGAYTPRATDLANIALNKEVSQDLQAWVHGTRLRSTEFKNYAMSRIYSQKTTNITPANVRYSFTHTAAKSKLHQFYLDLFPRHFKSISRVAGDLEEWDRVMQEHQELRICFLHGMSNSGNEQKELHKEDYMEADESGLVNNVVASDAHQVIPAKRKGNYMLMKNAVTGAWGPLPGRH
jgi:hypothetical protein